MIADEGAAGREEGVAWVTCAMSCPARERRVHHHAVEERAVRAGLEEVGV
jgi:hypothetical protein